ncbi:MAG: hypothetical protein P8013_12985 [Candidatus Sulfobium sp.]|jgi:hypothetical protein
MVLKDPLFYIYFIYGMSFLIMSFVIFRGARRATSIAFVATFYVLIVFGVMHGTTELIDWARYIRRTAGAGESTALIYLSKIFMIISFFALLQFAANLLTYRSNNRDVLRSLPALLFIGCAIFLTAKGESDILEAGLIVRHSFGFAGSLLSGIALLTLGNSMKEVGSPRLTGGLVAAGTAFICYSVFGGLIVDPVIGLPVQLFRAACALAIAISSFYILGVFRSSQ